MGNVVINGRTSVHAGSGGTVTSPDVCKTPNRCRPNTYTNVAKSSDTASAAGSVIVNGNPACHKDAIFAVSSGDESGSCGGTASGTIKQKAEFITFSPNVFLENIPATRQADLMTSNNRNTPPMPVMQPGAAQPPALSPVGAQANVEQTDYLLNPVIRGNSLPLGIVGKITAYDPNKQRQYTSAFHATDKQYKMGTLERWGLRINNVQQTKHRMYLSFVDQAHPDHKLLKKLDKTKIPADTDKYHIPLGVLDIKDPDSHGDCTHRPD